MNSRKEYHLKFNHEDDGNWYIDIPNWPFFHHNLMMVSNADKLCAHFSEDDKVSKVHVIKSDERLSQEGYLELERSDIGYGADYKVNDTAIPFDKIWLCPVTLFVLTEYPKYLYVKKDNAA